MKTVFTLLLAAIAFCGYSQTFERLTDISLIGNADPDGFTECNGKLYFSATDSVNKRYSLFVTDGTLAGTKKVKSLPRIQPLYNLAPIKLKCFNDKLYYLQDSVALYIWASDGTEAGTQKLAKVATTASSSLTSAYNDFIEYNGKLYYGGMQGLYATNGNLGDTTLIKQNTGPIRGGVVANNVLYFIATNNQNILWRSDGTTAGTVPLANLGWTSVSPISSIGNTVYFSKNDTVNGFQPWKTDGTVAGTQMIKNILPSASRGMENQIALNNKLYFSYGDLFYVTDGTFAGTDLVKEMDQSTSIDLKYHTVLNNKLYFVAYQNGAFRLFESDGTTNGTQPIALNPNPVISNLYAFNGVLYFAGQLGLDGPELYAYDGIAAYLVKNIYNQAGTNYGSYPANYYPYNGKLYFKAGDQYGGYEVWYTDGTDAGTKQLDKDIANGNAYPDNFTEMNGLLYFNAISEYSINNNLYATNGTTAGTRVIAKNLGLAGDMFVHNNKLYSSGYNSVVVSDGTTAGTVVIGRHRETSSSNPQPVAYDFVELNGQVYYVLQDTGKYYIMSTDGTPAGTFRLTALTPGGPDASFYPHLYRFNSKLVFNGQDNNGDEFLYVSDGLANPTAVKKLDLAPYSSGDKYFTEYDGKLYFSASDSAVNNALFVTDLTTQGTYAVKYFLNSSFSGGVTSASVVYKNELYFGAYDGNNDIGLWKTNSIGALTQLVLITDTSTVGGAPSNITLYNGKILFIDRKGLWISDGTASGTELLSTTIASVSKIVVFDSLAYIVYGLPGNRQRVYVTDGTAAGTVPFATPSENVTIYDYLSMVIYKNRLFFPASYDDANIEIWSYGGPLAIGLGNELSNGNATNTASLAIYPNPAIGNVNIALSGMAPQEVCTWAIYDITGQLMMQGTTVANASGNVSEQLNTSALSSGIYLMSVSSNSNKPAKGKFVICE